MQIVLNIILKKSEILVKYLKKYTIIKKTCTRQLLFHHCSLQALKIWNDQKKEMFAYKNCRSRNSFSLKTNIN